MELWEQKFVAMFIFKKPVCQYKKAYQILKCASIEYVFTDFNKDAGWMASVVDKVVLKTRDNIVGESYLDGSGWFKYNAMPNGRGVYQKWRRMEQLIRKYTQVVNNVHIENYDWSRDNVLHFRLKPKNIQILSTTKGFNDFISTKYATTGFSA